MARDHARINLGIWGDDDWRDLTPAAQHLYLLILTHPELTFAGVADWRPGRLRALASGWDRSEFDRAAHELATGLYIIVDEDTEEVMIRSFVKHDGLMKQRNMAVAMAKAYAAIASQELRGVFIHELRRLREADPELKGWDGCLEIMGNRSCDPASHPTGYPSINPSVDPSIHPSVDPSVKGEPNPSVDPSPTPAPSPAPKTPAPTQGEAAQARPARKRATRLPDGWMPDPDVIEAMRTECPYVDLEAEHRKFADYWAAQPGQKGVKADWNATWRNWVRRAGESVPARPSGRPAAARSWFDLATTPPADPQPVLDATVVEIGDGQ